MSHWIQALSELGARGEPSVLVTVAETRGSAPRGAGTKMVVGASRTFGTIGGGQLEFKATEIARERLARGRDEGPELRRFPLGPSLGQCCGGVSMLLFEGIPIPPPAWVDDLMELRRARHPAVLVTELDAGAEPRKWVVTRDGDTSPKLDPAVLAAVDELLDAPRPSARRVEAGSASLGFFLDPVLPEAMHVVLFGAGHVGRALVHVLGGLPCSVTWVDGRDQAFPAELPPNVEKVVTDALDLAVDDAPAGSDFLVMTHSHALDQALCERILRRGDQRYCGLIGSLTKRRRFERRLLAAGVSQQTLERLTCPIGIDGIEGKHPGAIAVAVAAELLRLHEHEPDAIWEAPTALSGSDDG